MRYLGGKARQAIMVRNAVAPIRMGRTDYLEPFIGGGSVFAEVAPMFRTARGGDVVPDLIELWSAVSGGWTPPETISKDLWQQLKDDATPSALRAWAGYAASYNGKWFAGYGPVASGRDYLAESARSLQRKADKIRHASVDFRCCDYSDHEVTSNTVVYCDPPYANTETYSAAGEFDHNRFWETANEWDTRGALVLVHEYSAPPGWGVLASSRRVETMHHGGQSSGARQEHLYARTTRLAEFR